ncbi:uncharacterized protein [Eucyclogobius newberryi]|uniref:uncharacterized protein n=1 Tax=Eucyclogobius newberryi TaxID=166745 RepID=UPI003B5A93A4
METAKSVFHAQLASVMDTLLASAVCEIAKIFESALSQHQAALLQRTHEEVSILRGELETVQRRCAEKKSTRSLETDDQPTSESDHCEDPSDPVQGLYRDFGGIKEEPQSLEEEDADQNESQSKMASAPIKTEHIQLNQQFSPEPLLPPVQCKDEMPDWDESCYTAAQIHKEATSSPSPLPTSPKVCSDTSQTERWAPGLSSTQQSTMENFTANESNCPAPMNRHAEYGVDECLEDIFLEQEPGNLASSHGNVQSPQRGQSGLTINIKQGSTFRSKERPQSNFHTFSLRNTEPSSHCPAASGVNGRPHSCPYCGKCFAYPSHQRRHLLRHTGLRLHSCQVCEKSFLTSSELTVHTRTHTGERPFGCGQCGKRFARSGNLRAHQRDVHLGKRPFACTECGKRFAHKGNLRVHNHRVHHGLLTSATNAHRL